MASCSVPETLILRRALHEKLYVTIAHVGIVSLHGFSGVSVGSELDIALPGRSTRGIERESDAYGSDGIEELEHVVLASFVGQASHVDEMTTGGSEASVAGVSERTVPSAASATAAATAAAASSVFIFIVIVRKVIWNRGFRWDVNLGFR